MRPISPFDAAPVAEGQPGAATALAAAAATQLFVGGADGAVRAYEADGGGGWALRRTRPGLAAGGVRQLAAAPRHGLLLCLAAADGVAAYALPSLKLKAAAGRTAGAALFGWDDVGALLAVALKRRLLLFRYDGLELVPLREAALAEPPAALAPAGPSVLVALRREFAVVDVETGAVRPLPARVAAAVAEGAAGAAGPASAARAPASGELLLTLGAQTTVLTPALRVASRIAWSAPAAHVVAAEPYAVALLATGGGVLEARLLDSGVDAAQQLELPGAAALAAAGGAAFAAAPAAGAVLALVPAPAARQVAQFVQLGEFEEALALCAGAGGAALADGVRLQYAAHLFGRRLYGDALSQLAMSRSAGALDLLALLPSLVPEPLRHLAAPPAAHRVDPAAAGADEFERAVAAAVPYLFTFRSRLAAAPDEGRPWLPALLDAALVHALLAAPDRGALLSFLGRPTAVDARLAAAALEPRGRYGELVALLRARGDAAGALGLLRRLSEEPGALPAPPAGAAAALRGAPGARAAVDLLAGLDPPPPLALVEDHAGWLLDADADAALGMLLRLGAPPAAVAAALPPAWRATYLERALAAGVADAAGHDQQLAALLLAGVAARGGAAPELPRLRALVRASGHLDCGALLRRLPAPAGGAGAPPPPWLDRLRVDLLERLGRHAEALRVLAHRLGDRRGAEAYCDRVHRRATAARQRGPPPPQQQEDGGGDGGVYMLLVRVLAEAPGADANGGGGSTPRAAAPALPPGDACWAEIAAMLGRKRGAVAPLPALAALPDGVPLAAVLHFLDGSLAAAAERRRRARLTASLQRAAHVTALADLADWRQGWVAVAEDRACVLCFKRLGGSAVLVYPGGGLAHLACAKSRGAAPLR